FDLSDEILRKIQEADSRGETMSLSDYLPLSSALQLNFGAGRRGQARAWALTGETRQEWSGQTHARLLGVLVVLPTEQGQRLPVGEWIPGMLKTAGRQYEKALPQD